MTSISRRTALGAGLALSTAAWLPAHAQAWPSRPIKLVVPFPPGGGTDLAGRIVAERLAVKLNQPVVIENRPGGSTAIGVMAVSAAEADGYTLLFSGSTSYTVNPAIRRTLSYDPFKQLTPVSLVVRAPLVLVTAADGPIKTVKDLAARARAKPGSVTYTTFGAGTAPHLAGEMLAQATGTKLMPVPYKGSAEANIGVIRGDVDTGIDTLASVNPHLQSGKLRVLAVISEKRSSLLPNIPAYGELGLSAAMLDAWYALAAPAGLPNQVRDRLAMAVAEVMSETEVRRKLQAQFMDAALLGPQGLREVMDSEITRYRALVARGGLALD